MHCSSSRSVNKNKTKNISTH